MTSSISSSVLSQYSTVGSQMIEAKANSVSILLSGDTSIASFTETLCSSQTDICTLSSISAAASAVVKAAEESGISEEAITNVWAFASQLQAEGYDTLTILDALGQAEELATSDPDTFEEIFTDTDSSSTTISAISGEEDESEDDTTTEETDEDTTTTDESTSEDES